MNFLKNSLSLNKRAEASQTQPIPEASKTEKGMTPSTVKETPAGKISSVKSSTMRSLFSSSKVKLTHVTPSITEEHSQKIESLEKEIAKLHSDIELLQTPPEGHPSYLAYEYETAVNFIKSHVPNTAQAKEAKALEKELSKSKKIVAPYNEAEELLEKSGYNPTNRISFAEIQKFKKTGTVDAHEKIERLKTSQHSLASYRKEITPQLSTLIDSLSRKTTELTTLKASEDDEVIVATDNIPLSTSKSISPVAEQETSKPAAPSSSEITPNDLTAEEDADAADLLRRFNALKGNLPESDLHQKLEELASKYTKALSKLDEQRTKAKQIQRTIDFITEYEQNQQAEFLLQHKSLYGKAQEKNPQQALDEVTAAIKLQKAEVVTIESAIKEVKLKILSAKTTSSSDA